MQFARKRKPSIETSNSFVLWFSSSCFLSIIPTNKFGRIITSFNLTVALFVLLKYFKVIKKLEIYKTSNKHQNNYLLKVLFLYLKVKIINPCYSKWYWTETIMIDNLHPLKYRIHNLKRPLISNTLEFPAWGANYIEMYSTIKKAGSSLSAFCWWRSVQTWVPLTLIDFCDIFSLQDNPSRHFFWTKLRWRWMVIDAR